jgi:hypothetical protein
MNAPQAAMFEGFFIACDPIAAGPVRLQPKGAV